MSFTGRSSPTRGTLVRLRTNLTFIESALSILKLKRDRLAEELNTLLKEMARREGAEARLLGVYTHFREAITSLGYAEAHSIAYSANNMKVTVTPRSVMNVLVPMIRVEEKPSSNVLSDASLYQVAEELQPLIEEWLAVACVEASLERIAYELTLVNRKINAIEKVVIPTHQNQITYIEGFLADEDLEDFTRIKHVKTVLREKKS